MDKTNPVRNTPLPNQPTARQIAHRLIDTQRTDRAGDESAARIAAAACDSLYHELARWVGPDGCHALFARAIAEARSTYPALRHIQLRIRSDLYIDGVAEAIMADGDDATATALQAMLVHLVELLGRLIGYDMATRLIEQSLSASAERDVSSYDQQEEA